MRGIKVKDFIEEQENVQWLIEGLLPNVGWTLLVGPYKSGKTTLALQMCEALRTGSLFFNRKTVPTTALYFQSDSANLEWKEILKRVCPEALFITVVDVEEYFLDNPEYYRHARNCIEHYKPGYVVFDCLYKLTSVSVNSEKIQGPLSQLNKLCAGIPWMLIHHPPHNESRASGHNSIGATCSSEWHVMPSKMRVARGRLVAQMELPMKQDRQGLWHPLRSELPEQDMSGIRF